MKKIFIISMLLFTVCAQSVPVYAIERVIDDSKAQIVHSLTMPKGLGEDLKDEVDILNQKNEDSDEYTNHKNNVYNELSDYMKLKYKLYDIHIVEDLHELTISKKFEKNVRGFIYYNIDSIVIDNTVNKVEHILRHELGHALDAYDETDNSPYKKFSKYSNTDEFKEIFDIEKYDGQNLSDEYHFTDKIDEYFAESYAIYLEKPDRMQKQIPRTYEFINKVANQEYIEVPVPITDYDMTNRKKIKLSPALDELKREKESINIA